MVFKSSHLRFQISNFVAAFILHLYVIQFDQHFKQESVLRGGVDTRQLSSEVCHAFLSTFFKYKCLSHLPSVQCYHWGSAQISLQCTQCTSWFQRWRCKAMSQIRKLKCPPGCAQLTFLAHTKSGGSRNQGLTALVVSAEVSVLPALSCRVFLQFCLFLLKTNCEMPAAAEKRKKGSVCSC